MLVKELGGEFELIKKLLPVSGAGAGLLLPNGDDAAVVESPAGPLVATVDTVVEGRHFNFEYFSPEQVGIRAIEGAASDIAAVGGVPRFVLCALVLPSNIAVETVEGIYRGMGSALQRVGAVLAGGDTSSGSEKLSITVTVLGEIPKGGRFLSRGGAKPGDLIMASGGLGGSAAGLALLQSRVSGFDPVTGYHLEPKCRIDIGTELAKYASAAIDISDGLSSEIHHLCKASGCGAVVEFEKIPVKPGVLAAAQRLGIDAEDWILNGGEEYELLFTMPESRIAGSPGMVIGHVTAEREILIRRGAVVVPLADRGFIHLK